MSNNIDIFIINQKRKTDMLNQSLLALACGDSYGSYFKRDGLMGVTYNIEKLPNKSVTPMITDDTKMAMILLKHYITHKNISTEKLSEEYRIWARTDGQKDTIGMHTYSVLVRNEKNKNSQGNGALMRVIPFEIELIKDGYSFEEAVTLINQDSAITHKNETIFMANRLTLDITINGIKVLRKDAYKNILSKLCPGYTAWVINSLYIVIKTLKMNLFFVDGFKYIVSQGGDTDTNCAIYGAIRGSIEDIRDSVNILDFLTMDVLKDLQ